MPSKYLGFDCSRHSSFRKTGTPPFNATETLGAAVEDGRGTDSLSSNSLDNVSCEVSRACL